MPSPDGRVDLRSDTVTTPTPAMRRAIADAEVGDDVYGEDPTVRRLEERVAHLLEKEAALFVHSGTMGNQISIRVHTSPGDEVIIERTGHSYAFESGGLSAISSVQACPIEGVRGLLDAEAVRRAIRPSAYYLPHTKLVVVENTSNGGGGTIYSVERINELGAVCKEYNLAFHLDGA